MGNKRHLLLILCFAGYLQTSNGQCQIGGGLELGPVPNHAFIRDVFRGIIKNAPTTGIQSIVYVKYGGSLTGTEGYLDITLVDSQFVVQTSTAFGQYEENETEMSISMTIMFQCSGGNQSPMVLVINIEDTNNNSPVFTPTNEFEFVLAPPLPPGFIITGCFNEITVKDIDLTTSSIIFEIEDNPYFEIGYDAVASDAAGPKHFKALLKTSTFIRTLKEPISLTVTATDVDATGDPPLSTTAKIRISGNTEFEFPDEPVFSQTFYFGTYTAEHQLSQLEPIYLQQGFDEHVNFDLEGEYKRNFRISMSGHQVTLIVTTPLPLDELVEKQIYLIVKADREYTSGDTATIVIHLPENIPLLFEKALYEGSIVDNNLQLPPLVLSQGYDGTKVDARVDGDLSSSFTATVQGNQVIVTMKPLTESIIEDNSFLTLPVVAFTERNETTTIVSLEIIKDDNVTPKFDEPIYTGSYDPVNSLTIGPIELVQGVDDTVSVDLHGEHKELFRTKVDGSTIILTVASVIPPELFKEQQITLSIEATKPRTVGARAAIIINLPAEIPLTFQKILYEGSIIYNSLELQPLILSQGYEGAEVGARVDGDLSSSFTVTVQGNQVIVTMKPLTESIIEDNSFLTLPVVAFTERSETTTIVSLKIIKDDNVTPKFDEPIYTGSYDPVNSLTISPIELVQGVDDTVSVDLHGEHKELFRTKVDGSTIILTVASVIPPELFKEQQITLSIEATKPRTVGARAAIIINLPAEIPLTFQKVLYEGSIIDNSLELQPLILSQGYEGAEVGARVDGDLSSSFMVTVQGNQVIVTMKPLTESIIEDNSFLTLPLVAFTERSETTTIVSLEIIKDDNVTPKFDEPIYTGSYDPVNSLTISPIELVQGVDDTVSVDLHGEHKELFRTEVDGSTIILTVASVIPPELFKEQQITLSIEATKPRTVGARAAIIINLPAEIPLTFQKVLYEGSIIDNSLELQPLILSQGYEGAEVDARVDGDLSSSFTATVQGNQVIVTMKPLTESIIEDNSFLTLPLVAFTERSETTTIVSLEIIKDDNVTPKFDEPIYTGSYDPVNSLTISPIELVQGVDDTVSVDLHGEHKELFRTKVDGSTIILTVASVIPPELFKEQQITLSIEATKPRTVGARAAIIINLPAEIPLTFQKVLYEGSIIDNSLELQPLILSQGYEGAEVDARVDGDLSSSFTATVQGNQVIVTMKPLTESIIEDNSFLTLPVVAFTEHSETTTIASLKIIKDDNVTPKFDKPIYTGSYDPVNSLSIGPIELVQGVDDTVSVDLHGEHKELFRTKVDGSTIILTVASVIPHELFKEQQITLSIEATKPRTVGARAAIIINLPAEIPLAFQKVLYEGSIIDNSLELQPLILSQGYEGAEVGARVDGDLSSSFTATVQGNQVIVTMKPLTESIIEDNSFLTLPVVAFTERSETTTIVSLKIIKDDNVTPKFDEPIYTGSYDPVNSLTIGPIELVQGVDDTVSVDLHGEHKELFRTKVDGSTISLTVVSVIPPELFNEQQILLSIEATKPRTVGARAAIIINLPADTPTDPDVVSFDKFSYEGAITNNEVEHEKITIVGFEGSNVDLVGKHSTLFEANLHNGEVTVNAIAELSLPVDIRHVTLELHAGTARAVLLLGVDQVDTPTDPDVVSFDKFSYEGAITNNEVEHEKITIVGFEGSNVDLVGKHSTLFEANLHNGEVTVKAIAELSLPVDIRHVTLELHAGTARAVLLLGVDQVDTPTDPDVVSFDKFSYEGAITNNEVEHEKITIVGFEGSNVDLVGKHSTLFEANLHNGEVTVKAIAELSLPVDIRHVTLELHAGTARAVLLLGVDQVDTPTDPDVVSFDKFSYEGAITNNEVEHEKITIVGFEGSNVDLVGKHSTLFEANLHNGEVTVKAIAELSLPVDIRHVTLELHAGTARAVLLLGVDQVDTPTDPDVVSFDKFSYEGAITNNEVEHEKITIVGFEGSNVDLVGKHSTLFEANLHNGEVTVKAIAELSLPVDIRHVTLELHAGTARAVLLLGVDQVDTPTDPDVVSFDKFSYEGAITNNEVEHEKITIVGFEGSNVDLVGKHSTLFEANLHNGEVTVKAIAELSLPVDIRHVTLELHAGTARAVLLLGVDQVDTPTDPDVVSFDKFSYEGAITNNEVEHEKITIVGFEGSNVDLVGKHSTLFEANLHNGEVTVKAIAELSLPVDIRHVTLELHAGTARAVLLLGVDQVDTPTDPDVVSFDKFSYEGAITNNEVEHEKITIVGFEGSNVDLVGKHSTLFEANLHNGEVTVKAIAELSLPVDIRHVTLELHAGTARAVLLLGVDQVDTPTDPDVVSFDKFSYEGAITNNEVEHEKITIVGFEGSNVDLVGKHSTLFEANLHNGEVTVKAIAELSLPVDIRHVTLELHAGTARAVLLLGVDQVDTPTDPDVVSFDKFSYEGAITNNEVEHEKITIVGFEGPNVDLVGKHSTLFEANLHNGEVTVKAIAELSLPVDIRHVTLELHAGTARAVLLLGVDQVDTPTDPDVVSFDKFSYEGAITNNEVEHEKITIVGFEESNVDLVGKHSTLFEANLHNGEVTVKAIAELSLPVDIRHVTLELHAGTARAVLLLGVDQVDTPTDPDVVSFDKFSYEGTITNNEVKHEKITIVGFEGSNVDLVGKHSTLFEANLHNGEVTVKAIAELSLLVDIRHVTLELHAGTARAVLLLGVDQVDTPTDPDVVSFDKFSYEGAITNNEVEHEKITIVGYEGSNVDLVGKHSTLFEANLHNGEVTVKAIAELSLPVDIRHVTLELHAGTARAVLLLGVDQVDTPTDPDVVSFDKFSYEGAITNNEVEHEKITIVGFEGSNVDLVGKHSTLFEANLHNGEVTVKAIAELSLPVDIRHVTLELHAGTARAVLLLGVDQVDTPTDPDVVSFDKFSYEGAITNNEVEHEKITIVGFEGSNVDLVGKHSTLFEANLHNGEVTVKAIAELSLPVDIRHVTLELHAGTARAVLLLGVDQVDTPTDPDVVSFDKFSYEGAITNNEVEHEKITIVGFEGPNVDLVGKHSTLFEANLHNGEVTVKAIAELSLPVDIRHVTLELHAGTARAVLLLGVDQVDTPTDPDVVSFDKFSYEGAITNNEVEHEKITIVGFEESNVDLVGKHSTLFEANLHNGEVTVKAIAELSLPVDIRHVTLELHAGTARAVLLLGVDQVDTPTDPDVVSFDKFSYEGTITNNEVKHEKITIVGFEGSNVDLVGKHSTLFEANLHNGEVTVKAIAELSLLVDIRHVTLELHAGTARAVLLLGVDQVDTPTDPDVVSFDKFSYEGAITNNEVEHEKITIVGYEGSNVDLVGKHSTLFEANLHNGEVTVKAIAELSLPVDIRHVTLELHAGTARAVLLLGVDQVDTPTDPDVVSFDKFSYEGAITNNEVEHEKITIVGFEGSNVDLVGKHSTLFEANLHNGEVTVKAIAELSLPVDIRHVTLELHAGTARAVLLLGVDQVDTPTDPDVVSFDKFSYEGAITNNEVEHEKITIVGFEGSNVDLVGKHSTLFEANLHNGEVTVKAIAELSLPVDIRHVTLELHAGTARAVLLLGVDQVDPPTEPEVSFDKVLYEGIITNSDVKHETITVTGFSGTRVELEGKYSSLFEADLNNGKVTVKALGSLTLPADIQHVTLELQAGAARAVLLLDVNHIDTSTPVVTFSSTTYVVRVKVTETGVVGQVQATADNGEAVRYSLLTDNVHLQERLIITDVGEIYLSAPVNSGLYRFQAVATTIFTQASGTTTVHLRAEAVTTCGGENIMQPQIVLDRDEEEAHDYLMISNDGCHFSLTNLWPLDQTWLYVNETGLHTRAIDREHESIAFMTLSQVQVEITLHCDSDKTRAKRSLIYDSPDPYDYGKNKWVLSDTIHYSRESSLVNLIVNDKNDNAPVFVGKDLEPIAVGYPAAELEEKVMPRSLIELQATDADIGENAALVYSSSEPSLAVSPTTGFVHIRNGAKVENDARLRVYATDQNGRGLVGFIDIIVKILDESNILVVTVRDAFLNNETDILARMSESIGYDIKILRSVVISEDEINEEAARKSRDISTTTGASLQLYIYGLIDREPVSVERLNTDITNTEIAQVNIAGIVSLEDHLASQEICFISGRDTGLLVATIVLSILLFIVIVLIAVWFFLRWRRKQNYGRFSDTNSESSRNELGPKPEEVAVKPRINIEELKRSERRLQELLDAPIREISVEPISSRKDAILDMPPLSDPNASIVIQSTDKLKDANDELSEDEFGERKMPKRKSVVTFNENVEKIIHVEDNDVTEASPSTGFEIYRL